MSKSSSKASTRHRRKGGGRSSAPEKRSIRDSQIYLGLVIIGAAVVGFGAIVRDGIAPGQIWPVQ